MPAWLILLPVALADTPAQYGATYELHHGEGPGPQVVTPAKVTASSTLTEGSVSYAAARVADGKLSTAWCEGQPGSGTGASLTLHFDTPIQVRWIELWGGYFLDEKRLFTNERVQSYRISFDDHTHQRVRSSDVPRDGFAAAQRSPNVVANAAWVEPGLSAALQPVLSKSVTIEVLSVFPGDKYTDLCISEVKVYTQP